MKEKPLVINLYGGPGTGKCHGKDTPILMYNGDIKMVQDIKIGDLVMGNDSTPRMVLNIVNGNDLLYKIKPNKGDSYIVNKEHILSLKFNHHNKEKTNNIAVKDFLSKSEWFQARSKAYKTAIDFPEKKINIDPYFLGLWLGDGEEGNQRISLSYEPILRYLENYGKKLGLKCKQHSKKKNNNQTYSLSTGNIGGKENILLSNLRKLNLIKNKRIPFEYKCNSRDIRLEILAGLIDSDGYVKNNYCSFNLKSKKLTKDLVFLANSLGFNSFYKPVQKGYKKGDIEFTGNYFNISIIGDLSVVPVKLEHKKATYNHIKNPLRSGIEIEKLGEGDFFGFQLSGNQLYCLGDCTVTHNSTTAAHVFALLKQRDINAELVREYAKDLVWEGRTHLLSGVFPYQLVVFSKQNKRMFDLVGKVDVIITDSPLWLSYHYSGHDEQMLQLIIRTTNWYDETHFFLRRQKKFNPMGRIHNEKESKLIDMQLREMLDQININYVELDADECAAELIIDEIKEKIWIPKG